MLIQITPANNKPGESKAMYIIAALLASFLATGQPPAPTMEFPGKAGQWRGFVRHDFTVAGVPAIVVEPKAAAEGRPWIWRTEFFDHRPEIDLALVEKGFYLVHLQVGNTFGCPSAMEKFEVFYRELTSKYGFSKKCVLEGLSRGGLYAYNYAAKNPEGVAAILGDNPVCDFKSWPGGKGKGPGSKSDWAKLQKDYGFKNEQEAVDWKFNPVDNLEPLAKAGIPILHLCGDADEVVPYSENTVKLFENYRRLGGKADLILKPGYKHHPHGLDDPKPAIEWILRQVQKP